MTISTGEIAGDTRTHDVPLSKGKTRRQCVGRFDGAIRKKARP